MASKTLGESWRGLSNGARTVAVVAAVLTSLVIWGIISALSGGPTMADAGKDIAPGATILIVGLVLYFLPSIVGWKKRNHGAIQMLNLLLGWTVIGWIVALVWALTNDVPLPIAPAPPLLCSRCGTYSHPQARFCANCASQLTV